VSPLLQCGREPREPASLQRGRARREPASLQRGRARREPGFPTARACRLGAAIACVVLAGLAGTGSALAAPLWRLSSRAAPTNLSPGGTGLLVASADNLGDTAVTGSTKHVTLTDVLPEGLDLTGGKAAIRARRFHSVVGEAEEEANWSCAVSGLTEVTCTTSLTLAPYEGLELLIPVHVAEPAGTVASLINEVKVEGGEAEGAGGTTMPSASLGRPVQVSAEPVRFGLERDGYSLAPEQEGGSPDVQAGSHPFQLTTSVDFNQTVETIPVKEGQPPAKGLQPAAPALTRGLSFNLPPGLLGNVTAVERCSEADFLSLSENNVNLCPASTAIGVATVSINITRPYGYVNFAVPLFNLVPRPGEPARFGFEIYKVSVELDTSVRTGGDYGVTASVSNASQTGQLLGSQVTFWGVPGDPRHDASRGWACLLDGTYVNHEQPCTAPNPRSTVPFLMLPTSCTGQLSTAMQGDSWTGDEVTGEYTFQNGMGEALARLEGCSAVPFEPSIAVQPVEEVQSEGRSLQATTGADVPTGLDVGVKLPQQGTLQAGSLGEADVRSATVTLPEGVQLNPSDANGLQACSEAQIGYQGPGGVDPLSPGAEEPLHFSGQPAACPQASKLGLVRLRSPLLGEELQGAVYLAEPAPQGEAGKNPFNGLLALYIVAEDPVLGIRAKLAGEANLNPQTGQITTTFADTPQVPFEELDLQLFGGPTGPLTTPAACGNYTASASFTPWSGTPSVNVASEPAFQITSGPGGASCSGSQPFAPSLVAGASSLQAGGYTSFSLQLARPDGDQTLTGLSVRLPAGDAAILKAVTPCPEPQASEGACGPESEIGQATATAGAGPDPYTVTGGRVYITGPYDGAPFGLSIATPAVAGPFNLGDVVVRSKIEVDPHTAQVTITSPLPTFVQGIGRPKSGVPLDLRDVYVTVDRPDFEYNPTNCNPASVTASLTGAQGATAEASSRFQVEGCRELPFKPDVSAQTQGKTSKAGGASLKLTFKSNGGEAHVAKTILTIPAILPARLSTIQKACVAKVFEADPAACPEGSEIGTATVHTPVLKSPLTGPIYLVSHGNAAWPDAELVLQGEGITIILDGQTAIKKGVTTSSFLSVPDAPFETVQASLPEGPHSALTTNLPARDRYSLCARALTIPTQLTGQNGTFVTENVRVTVEGCAAVKASKTKKLTRTRKLAKVLKACREQHPRSRAKRAACEHNARIRYAAERAAHNGSTRPDRARRARSDGHS
jgi:hypothetical protein